MASFKFFVPLVLCVLLATLCITSAKPAGEESNKKAKTALSDAELKEKLNKQLKEIEDDVDDFLKKIEMLDAELDEIQVTETSGTDGISSSCWTHAIVALRTSLEA